MKGRPEGQEIKDKVYLKEEITKEETIIFMEDKLLYERDINEGMRVVIDGDGRLQKGRIDHERSDKKGKISTLILGFAIPVFLGNLLQLTYSLC